MKILIVRHAEPNYEIDSLTEKGWREAKYLSERLTKLNIDHFYVSPLGRARDTASLTLEKMQRKARVCEWLREFEGRVLRPDKEGKPAIAWDWLPQDWTGEARFYDKDMWMQPDIVADSNVLEKYEWVIKNFDALLETHGYKREGNYYRALNPNKDTVCLFCHFGVESVLLSRLLNISPMVLWHSACALPSSVTTVVTEERREGIASFRLLSFGDLSHLYAREEAPSFAARFCECYTDGKRRD